MAESPATTSVRKGVWLFPSAPAMRMVEAVIAAEQCGLDEIWLADEGVSREPMAILAAAAAETSSITLATGITSPLLRHPGALASTAMTIDELSGGRFRLGIGLGGGLSLDPFGIEVQRPVGVIKDALLTARSVFDGQATQHYGPPSHAAPPRKVGLWVGGRGPQIVRTAARHGDGVFVSGCSPQQHDSIAENARSVNPDVGLALYQSAADVELDHCSTWDQVGPVLEAEASRIRPSSVGINLVDLNAGDHDPVELVRRAAQVLAQISSP